MKYLTSNPATAGEPYGNFREVDAMSGRALVSPAEVASRLSWEEVLSRR